MKIESCIQQTIRYQFKMRDPYAPADSILVQTNMSALIRLCLIANSFH